MLRRLHLLMAALAMLIAPVAMQSGMAMAAMPMNQRELAQTGHCGDGAPGEDEKGGAMTQLCVAMCSAVAPLGTDFVEPIAYDAPPPAGFRVTEHRPFLADLPTPPPRAA